MQHPAPHPCSTAAVAGPGNHHDAIRSPRTFDAAWPLLLSTPACSLQGCCLLCCHCARCCRAAHRQGQLNMGPAQHANKFFGRATGPNCCGGPVLCCAACCCWSRQAALTRARTPLSSSPALRSCTSTSGMPSSPRPMTVSQGVRMRSPAAAQTTTEQWPGGLYHCCLLPVTRPLPRPYHHHRTGTLHSARHAVLTQAGCGATSPQHGLRQAAHSPSVPSPSKENCSR